MRPTRTIPKMARTAAPVPSAISTRNFNGAPHRPLSFSHLPGVSAVRWGPCAQGSADQRDLAYVITIVSDHLPEDSFETAGSLFVALMNRFYFALELRW